MSVPNTPHAEHEPDAHDDDAAEDELDPNEPHTPGWLTLLGCGLFLFVGIVVLATDDPAEEEASSTAPVAAEVAAPAPTAPTQPAPAQTADALKDPQAARAAAQKLIEQLKLRQPGGAGIQPPQPAAP